MKSFKLFLTYLTAIASIAFMLSCEEDVEKPTITSFSATPTTAAVRQAVIFNVEYEGTYAVIWTGDATHNYDVYQEQMANPPADITRNIAGRNDKGAVVTGNSYQYNYLAAGTYTAILIVTNAGNMGETIEQEMQTIEITVQ